LIQKRQPKEHRNEKIIIKSARTFDAVFESIDINYPADTQHLAKIVDADLNYWDRKFPCLPSDPATALDVLYSLKPPNIR
jgi:hypothetical protein